MSDFVRSAESYRCPFCGRRSHNRHDAEQRFCAACGLFLQEVLGELEALIPEGRRIRRVHVPAYLLQVAAQAIRTADRTFNQLEQAESGNEVRPR